MDDSPLSVRITEAMLATSTLLFSVLFTIAFIFEPINQTHFLYPLLLVALPAIAYLGVTKRREWGRGLASLALVSLWAFLLRMLWLNFQTDYFPEAVFAGSFYSYFIGLMASFAVAIPVLLYRFNRGEAEEEFFESPQPDRLSAGGERRLAPSSMPYGCSVVDFVDSSERRIS